MIQGYILLGSPGSGKGTIGQFMQSYGFEQIASGDILRSEVKEGTSIGRQTQQLIQEGKQVPDALITEIVLKRLDMCIAQGNNFVLDGFPQTVPQWKSLCAFLARHSGCAVSTICVDVAPETALRRMAERMSCPECATIYNKHTAPPDEEGTCNACKGPLVSRESDAKERAQGRLMQFERTTKKVMDFVRQNPHVFSIDGNSSILEVRNQLIPILSS